MPQRSKVAAFALSALSVVLAAGTAMATCPPDCNGDDKLNINDFICFKTQFDTRTSYGDYNKDGKWNINDFIAFQSDFNKYVVEGCSGSGGGDPNKAELAGRSLGKYPFVDFNQNYNFGTTVQLAIDPTLHADITGKATNIYIVANKTAAQWASDKSLSDVRGSAQAKTFSGSDVQGNTVSLTSSGSLGGGTGTDISKGYDLVIDANTNGQLDAGDYIDGAGDEPGFWITRDLTASGDIAYTQVNSYTVTWPSLSLSFDEERLYYPADIASRGKVPLVVMSHGNGHQYTWYDYWGRHLASYGYVAMSHQNNTGPGIQTASDTTLFHTDAFLGSLGTIAGGALVNHVDGHRILWMGHSRGGEGIARAYDKIVDGTYVPTNYVATDIILIDSIAPTDFLGTASSNPHDRNHELLYGSADGDVCGCASSDIADSFNIFERATEYRTATYVQGADHNDFNCCGFNDFSGPAGTEIGRPEAQQVAKASYIALCKYWAEGDQSAREYLWRQYENLRGIGVAGTTVVDREFKEGASAGNFVIDDFQSQAATGTSSSGGTVAFTVSNLTEGLMHDANTSFTWSAADPFNGMTRGRSSDTMKGVVFDYTTGDNKYYEQGVVAAAKNFTAYTYLSFRACQGTRHPETIGVLADQSFDVTLRDGTGKTSSINIDAYGGGLEEVYQRTGEGTGTGWQNEFDVIRIRVTDFAANGSGIDLTNIAAIKFEFGSAHGTARGRIAIDDIELSKK